MPPISSLIKKAPKDPLEKVAKKKTVDNRSRLAAELREWLHGFAEPWLRLTRVEDITREKL